jgi:hypothetical protein
MQKVAGAGGRSLHSKDLFEVVHEVPGRRPPQTSPQILYLIEQSVEGSEADRKLDIFLTPADVALPNSEHDLSNILDVGKHKQNADEDCSTKTLVQLAGYAQEVFGSQPNRRFILSFTIYESMMRLLVFDRSGPDIAPRNLTSTKSQSGLFRLLPAMRSRRIRN